MTTAHDSTTMSCNLYYKPMMIVDDDFTMSRNMYYKPMMIVDDDFRVVNNLEASLTDDAKVVVYNRHMFIVQATGVLVAVSQFSCNWF